MTENFLTRQLGGKACILCGGNFSGNRHFADKAIATNLSILFFFTYLELYRAIKRQDLQEAEGVCIRANKNLNFSKALIFVVENELHEMYDMLMKYGARFNIHNENGGKMFLLAVSKQNVDLCKKLLRDGTTKNTIDCPNPSVSFKKAIHKIFKNEIMEIFNSLSNYKLPKNVIIWIEKESQMLLHDLICSRNYKLCEELITEGINITTKDSEGNFALHVAAEVNDVDILNLLIENKADIKATNNDQKTALRLAAENSCKEAYDILQLHDDDKSVNYEEHLPYFS